jgi:hypothetical protein
MEDFLQKVYDGVRNGDKFGEMVNIGLVKMKIKKGALLIINKSAVQACLDAGLFVEKYTDPGVKNVSIVTYKPVTLPEATDPNFHKKVGKILGFLTPINLDDKPIDRKAMTIYINITNRGRKSTKFVFSEMIFGKSDKAISTYIQKYVDGIAKMKLPPEFKIIEIIPEIKNH